MVNVHVELLNIDTIRPFFEDQSIKIQTRVDCVNVRFCVEREKINFWTAPLFQGFTFENNNLNMPN